MSSELKVDTISEKTSASGVTVDGVLIKDGNVDGVDVSAITQGITEIDLWQLTANVTSNGDITSNLQRMVGTAVGYKGTGMTESSGVFTFPSTGLWLVTVQPNFEINNDPSCEIQIKATTDNFSSVDTRVASAALGNRSSTGAHYYNIEVSHVIDVTDTSNVKVKFAAGSFASNSTAYGGTTASYSTSFRFIRLGDT